MEIFLKIVNVYFFVVLETKNNSKKFRYPDPIPLTTGFRDILEDIDDINESHFYENKKSTIK